MTQGFRPQVLPRRTCMTRTNDAGETRIVSATDSATPAGDVQPVYPHTMRLQRFLARAGVASRRGSEDLSLIHI